MAAEDTRRELANLLATQTRFDQRLRDLDEVEQYDVRHGVETSAPVEPWQLSEATDHTLAHHTRYSPTPVRTIRKVLDACPVRYEDVTFVDFGCGKGRVMLVAAEFPFRKVIGVEFSGDLARTARRNIARCRDQQWRCTDLEVRCEDAAEFVVPADAAVFYFYEPFSTTVAAAVVANIETSLRRCPRRAVLCVVGRGVPGTAGWQGERSRLAAVLTDRPAWRLHPPLVASPDDPYYDAWLFVNTHG